MIEQYKTTGYDDGGFAVLRERTDNPRTLLFLDIAEQVYHHYQSVLKQRNQIDFADMINDAHFYLQEIERQNVTLPYKYIIIDEFQDIARQRFNLTKRLSQITQAKVVAVGDDWQSIYAFSGSDITLFTRFLELMGAGTELKITHTYRNSQELIDIAGGFVQRNTSQIRKQLISPKHLENPIVLEVFDDSIKPMERLADTIEHIIGEILSEYGEQSSILLIGRYNYDMYKLYRTNRFSELPGGAIRSEKYPNAKITFMTAHSSKGLGYDNVRMTNKENAYMEPNDKIQLFENQRIRTAWDEEKEEWYFSVVDVVAILTDQPDTRHASTYWAVLKKRLNNEGADQLLINCKQLKMTASDGKKRLTDVADTEQLLRIIQSIPSPKAEPFKLWLAQVGRERIEETIDPELTIERALETYLKKGYTREWINQRLQAIQVRKELTDEWDARGVQKGVEYAILTDEISRAWSGMSTRQYKNLKGLKKENLRDNMTTLELVLNMLAEATTTEISKQKAPTTLSENIDVARAGGKVAGDARKAIETQTGVPVITSKNAAQLSEVVTNLLEDAGDKDEYITKDYNTV